MPVEYKRIKLSELHEDPANARLHPEENLADIRASLKEFGQVEPLVVQKNSGKVIGGNGRLKVMRELGWDECDVAYVDFDNMKSTALGIALNRAGERAEWDKETLDKLLGEIEDIDEELAASFAELEKECGIEEPLGEADAEPQIDRAAELQKKWGTATGQLWLLGEHRLLCGDSTKREDVERVMGGERAGLCFTSPPYNAGSYALTGNVVMQDKSSRYSHMKDDLPEDEYLAFLNAFTDLAIEYCTIVAVNIQQLANNKFAVLRWVGNHIDNFVDRAIWYKGAGNPAMAERVMNSRYEDVWLFSSENRPSRAIKSAPPFRGTVPNVWEGRGASSDNTIPEANAATMPPAFAAYCLSSWTEDAALIYEPFAGSGTTLVAAQNLNRKCYGIEISPAYCAVILERMQTAFPALEIRQA